jgi:hypothetical protein
MLRMLGSGDRRRWRNLRWALFLLICRGRLVEWQQQQQQLVVLQQRLVKPTAGHVTSNTQLNPRQIPALVLAKLETLVSALGD